jgi:hypothetical protein
MSAKNARSSSWSSVRTIGIILCTTVVMFFFVESSFYKAMSSKDKGAVLVKNLRNEPKKSSNGDLLYCNTQLPDGSEGATFLHADQWILHHLLINIRHGDRSSIHNIPGAQPLASQVNADQIQYIEYSALKYVPRLNSFKLASVGPSSLKNSEGDLPDAFNSSTLFRVADSSIAPGILTTRGFMQHINLGQYLARAYNKFLSNYVTSVDSIYVRSTNYRRTILSISALMITMLPQIGGPKPEDQMPILSYSDEAEEIMHGVGLRLSSHLEHGGETSHAVLFLSTIS